MSCLDVMYQVYGTPPQPYFTTAYSPYHHQKLAFYSKMQEPHDGVGRSGGGGGASSFSTAPVPAAIKEEEDCGRDKEPPPEAEYLGARCVLFSYFQGDVSTVVDQHFSRALSQPSGYASGSSGSSKSARDGPFPMNQRSFPPSFWNSTYQSSVSSGLGAPPHAELAFPGDPYSASASLHGHLHQPSPDVAWHPSHHHHHHHHHPYSLGGQGSGYPRPGVHEVYGATFDPRYGSLLVPSVRSHHRLASSSTVPGPSGSPCDLGGKGESGATSSWSGAFAGASPDSLALNMDTGLQTQDKSKDLYWF
ncbi:unnamed protein product [Merluccius merluccius]